MAGVGDASGIVVAKGYGGEVNLEPSMSNCGIAMGRAIATTIYNQDDGSNPSSSNNRGSSDTCEFIGDDAAKAL